MKKKFKRGMINHLIIYPVIFTIIWTILFNAHSNLFVTKLALNNIKLFSSTVLGDLPIHIPLKSIEILFGFLFGYVYGTLSLLIKARQFKGLPFVIVFFTKLIVSFMFSMIYGFLYFAEIILIPLIYFIYIKISAKKKPKVTRDNYMDVYNSLPDHEKEEILSQIKKMNI